MVFAYAPPTILRLVRLLGVVALLLRCPLRWKSASFHLVRMVLKPSTVSRALHLQVGDSVLPTLGYFESNGTRTPGNVTIMGSNFGPASSSLLVTFTSGPMRLASVP
jgi:hypothetical protein